MTVIKYSGTSLSDESLYIQETKTSLLVTFFQGTKPLLIQIEPLKSGNLSIKENKIRTEVGPKVSKGSTVPTYLFT